MRIFDTWASRLTGTAWHALADYLEAVPNGRMIVLSVADEAGINEWSGDVCAKLTTPAVGRGLSVLGALGATEIQSYCYGDSWGMVTVKGQGRTAEQVGHATEATAVGTVTVA